MATMDVTVALTKEDSCYDLLAKEMILSAKQAKAK